MKKLFFIYILMPICVTLTGCTSANINQTFTSNGLEGYQITCGGFFGGGDISACYLAAGKTCGDKGYSVSHTGANSIIISCKNLEIDNAAPLISQPMTQ